MRRHRQKNGLGHQGGAEAIDAGFAYPAQGSVYFDVAAWSVVDGSDYGLLSGNNLIDMEQGETDNVGKRSP